MNKTIVCAYCGEVGVLGADVRQWIDRAPGRSPYVCETCWPEPGVVEDYLRRAFRDWRLLAKACA